MDNPVQNLTYGGAVGKSLPGSSVPTRESEVQRELGDLSHTSAELRRLSEELVQRLASVLSPKEDGNKPSEPTPSVSTPLASNIREVNLSFRTTMKTLQFILQGLEL